MLNNLSLNIKKNIKTFYILAVIITILSIGYNILYVFSGNGISRILFLGNQLFAKGFLSTGLFIVVMFTGALSTKWFIKKPLTILRGEIAITACIFIIPHMFESLLFWLVGIYNSQNILIILIVGIIAFVVAIPLCITSFKKIKIKMNAKKWKKIQRWSYVFYFLVYFHIMLAFLFFEPRPSILDALALSFIFLIYTLLRLLKYSSDRDKRQRTIRKAQRSVNKSRREIGY